MIEIDEIALDNFSKPKIPDKFRHAFIVKCHNNQYNGRKEFKGTKYERCLVLVENPDPFNMCNVVVTITYFFPNGNLDSECYPLYMKYQLTDLDCLRIEEEHSSRQYLKMLFKIKKTLNINDEIPLRKRYAKKCKRIV